MTQVPSPPVHDYLSTACWHDLHPRCRQDCKFCQAPCACRCHVIAQGIENPSGGPVVATPPVELATEPAASNEVHRKALERIAREVVLAKEYTAPIVVALDVADAIQAAGWRPPAQRIEDRDGLAALPTNTVIRLQDGDVGRLDHGSRGEYEGFDTRIQLFGGMFRRVRFVPEEAFPAAVLSPPGGES